ncbi:STAS domain-containing protein [Parashewanella spongiae]|uniref:STAS domain-containing protein n=1 Tax=Parashewanella spongiae TaxID=342950 RepID=A0A3A6U2X0_9GAMM|nr:STAS domain-containing protein [Parashewanella spongiae]MCL1077477.1 STAS domain-containing protein [Parashewanella spongiae]RJY18386.1 STAS domain-containing protein [Parashewanella spongiae]
MAEFQNYNNYCKVTGRLARQDVVTLWPKQDTLLAAEVELMDLSALEFIDSSGIAFLFHLVEQQQQANKPLKLINPAEQLQPLIALYNLQTLFSEA